MASSISTSSIASLIPKRSLVDLARHHVVDNIAATASVLLASSNTALGGMVMVSSSSSTTTTRNSQASSDGKSNIPQERLHSAKRIRSSILMTLVGIYVALPIGVVFGFFRSSEWVSLTKSHPGLQSSFMAITVATIGISRTHFRHHHYVPLIILLWLSLLKYSADYGALPNLTKANHDHLLSGKVCVVTGGNSGIGWATAELLVRHGAAHVIVTCRTLAKCQPALQHLRAVSRSSSNATVVSAHRLELTNLTSAYQLTQELTSQYSVIHYLFNNAGSTPIHDLTVDGFEDGFGGMHLGHVAVTLGLLPLLQRAGDEDDTMTPARIIFVSSEMAVASAVGVFGFDPFGVDFDQIGSDGEGDLRGEVTRADGTAFRDLQAYGRAKLCNVLTALELNRRLTTAADPRAHVIVHAIHPGAVLTRTAQHAVSDVFRVWWLPGLATLVQRIYLPWLWRTPEQAAQALLYAAIATKPEAMSAGGQYLDAMCRPFWTNSDDHHHVSSNLSVIRKEIGKHTIAFYEDPVQALQLADQKWSRRLWEVSLSLLRNSPARDLVEYAP